MSMPSLRPPCTGGGAAGVRPGLAKKDNFVLSLIILNSVSCMKGVENVLVRPAIRLVAAALAVGMTLGLFQGGRALAQETTLERIARTGQFRVGMREDAAPFAYIDESGKHVGFSVDMAYLLAEKLAEYAGRPVEVVPVTVTPQTRIPLVVNGTIDIEMGSTSKT